MTIEELKFLIEFIDCTSGVESDVRLTAEDKQEIISALSKEIPEEPDYEGDGYDENGILIYDTWICPSCGEKYEVDYDDHKCCPNCGQALDWSSEK